MTDTSFDPSDLVSNLPPGTQTPLLADGSFLELVFGFEENVERPWEKHCIAYDLWVTLNLVCKAFREHLKLKQGRLILVPRLPLLDFSLYSVDGSLSGQQDAVNWAQIDSTRVNLNHRDVNGLDRGFPLHVGVDDTHDSVDDTLRKMKAKRDLTFVRLHALNKALGRSDASMHKFYAVGMPEDVLHQIVLARRSMYLIKMDLPERGAVRTTLGGGRGNRNPSYDFPVGVRVAVQSASDMHGLSGGFPLYCDETLYYDESLQLVNTVGSPAGNVVDLYNMRNLFVTMDPIAGKCGCSAFQSCGKSGHEEKRVETIAVNIQRMFDKAECFTVSVMEPSQIRYKLDIEYLLGLYPVLRHASMRGRVICIALVCMYCVPSYNTDASLPDPSPPLRFGRLPLLGGESRVLYMRSWHMRIIHVPYQVTQAALDDKREFLRDIECLIKKAETDRDVFNVNGVTRYPFMRWKVVIGPHAHAVQAQATGDVDVPLSPLHYSGNLWKLHCHPHTVKEYQYINGVTVG